MHTEWWLNSLDTSHHFLIIPTRRRGGWSWSFIKLGENEIFFFRKYDVDNISPIFPAQNIPRTPNLTMTSQKPRQYVAGKSRLWLHIGSVSLTLTFAFHCFVIIIIHKDLSSEALALCLKRLTHPLPDVGLSRRYLQDNGLYFTNSSPSLSYKRTQHPDPLRRWLFWDISLSSS